MNRPIFYAMAAGLAVCLSLTAWLTWSNWQLQQQVHTLSQNNKTPASQPETDWLQRLTPQQPPATPFAAGSWDPFAELDRLQQQMDRWFQGSGTASLSGASGGFFSLTANQPAIRIEEDTDAFRVHISVPDGSEIELNTEVDGQRLTVSGVVSSSVDNSDRGFSRSVFSSSQFSRQFPLRAPVDSLGITKETDDNQIIITLPKV